MLTNMIGHHIPVTIAGFYTLAKLPPNSSFMDLFFNPVKESVDYYPYVALVIVYILAYMVFDFVQIKWILKDNSLLGVQH